MLLNILLFLLCFLHSQGRRVPDEDRWNIKYNTSNTTVGEFDRVINRYDFNIKPFGKEIPFNGCDAPYVLDEVWPLPNYAGYVYCTETNKGIKQICPPGTKVSYEIGGCVNITTNKSVFPIGSRCASQPCKNGGACFDFPSADGYICKCNYAYEGLHCHLTVKTWYDCGGKVGKMFPRGIPFTDNMALDYICLCYDTSRQPATMSYAKNNCYSNELFVPKCEESSRTGALPFTNKGFYICPRYINHLFIKSCPLHHVWNGIAKKCVFENN